uniref:schlafen family member 13-like n=1 Tax=Myxine glutinosa TaxID=7769 RepID=UPI00358F92BA
MRGPLEGIFFCVLSSIHMLRASSILSMWTSRTWVTTFVLDTVLTETLSRITFSFFRIPTTSSPPPTTPCTRAEDVRFKKCEELPEDTIEIVESVTFGENARDKMKDKKKKKKQCEAIVKAACILLNSHGGVIVAKILNMEDDHSCDGHGLDIDRELIKLISGRTLKDFFDFKEDGSRMLIFVTAWNCGIGDNSYPRLCTIDLGMFERNETETKQVENTNVVNFLQRKKAHQNEAAETMFNKKSVTFDEHFGGLGESQTVEFKQYGQTFDKTKQMLPRYVSSFANSGGGYIFIGVDDKEKKVVGCLDNETSKLRSIKPDVDAKWGDLGIRINFINVDQTPDNQNRCVIAIHVPNRSGKIIFAKSPICYKIKDCKIHQMDEIEWLEIMNTDNPGNRVSRNKAIAESSLKSITTPTSLDEKEIRGFFKLEENDSLEQGPTVLFPDLHSKLIEEKPALSQFDKFLMKTFNGHKGFQIYSRSWAGNLGKPNNNHVVCDVLVLVEGQSLQLFTVVNERNSNVKVYCMETAHSIKTAMVKNGEYSNVLCVIPKIFALSDLSTVTLFDENLYPESYLKIEQKYFWHLLKSLAVSLLVFESILGEHVGVQYLSFLTLEQFNILHKRFSVDNVKSLFVQGLPGTGKTVLAKELIKKLKNKGNSFEDILYLCENQPLRDKMRDENLCRCETRCAFMKNEFPHVKHVVVDEAQNFRHENGENWFNFRHENGENWFNFRHENGENWLNFCHENGENWFNFCHENGGNWFNLRHENGENWFKKVKDIQQQQQNEELGVVWIFFDFFQKADSYETGLPKHLDPIESLDTIVRCGEAVSKVVQEYCEKAPKDERQERALENLKLLKTFPGDVKTIPCEYYECPQVVAKLILVHLYEGYSPHQIAVLYRTEKVAEMFRKEIVSRVKDYGGSVKATKAPGMEGFFVVDSILRFSGLESEIVIGVDPRTFDNSFENNIKLMLASRAVARLYIIEFKK